MTTITTNQTKTITEIIRTFMIVWYKDNDVQDAFEIDVDVNNPFKAISEIRKFVRKNIPEDDGIDIYMKTNGDNWEVVWDGIAFDL